MKNDELARRITDAFGLPEGSAPDPCSNTELVALLDGLIEERRGAREGAEPRPPHTGHVTNNLVLKKLRIALAFQEPQVLAALAAGGNPMSARELSTLFRKRGNKHYRKCSDDVLAAFLTGIAVLAENATTDPGAA